MRVVCSQCRRIVREDGIGGSSVATLELCGDCADYARRLRARIPGRERLAASPSPLLVTKVDGRVVAANTAFAALTGRTAGALDGWLAGDAMGCERARLPGGCGRTVRCQECTLRRMIAEVGRTRIARWRVPMYLMTAHGRREICVTMRPEGDDLVVLALEDVEHVAETA
jgi:PAS domain-containing protein